MAGLDGFVVDNVNVSVFAYDPVRSASPASIRCAKSIVTASLEAGAAHVSRFAPEPTFTSALPGLVAVCAFARSGCGSEKEPLTR